ncbi:MAG: DegV family protein [Lachnospiraceae bacterium]|jgi:DegV family protein with EDD domain|nr:DegV family protein [Lachnospiraceae bacterium]MEE3460889.1 DegV family protein [Lachnospiraceae bacterium]
MNKYKIICSSTVDMPLQWFKDRDVPYISFHFNMDGKDYKDDMGQTMPLKDFYEKIKNGALPTTSQPNAEEYIEIFRPYLEDGYDIIYLELSSGISAAVNSSNIAKDTLLEEFPDRRIEVIDTFAASSGYGLLMDYALDLKDNGSSMDEVIDWIEKNKLKVHHWFFSSDLSAFYRGGRISATKAAFGTLLNICPLMNVDYLGRLIPRENIRTKKKAARAMVDKIEKFAIDGASYDGKMFMCNSACEDDAHMVIDMIEERYPQLKGKILLNTIGTTIGTHTGTGTVALFFMGETRTD